MKEDDRNLACASDQVFGGLRCGYRLNLQAAGAVSRPIPDASALRHRGESGSCWALILTPDMEPAPLPAGRLLHVHNINGMVRGSGDSLCAHRPLRSDRKDHSGRSPQRLHAAAMNDAVSTRASDLASAGWKAVVAWASGAHRIRRWRSPASRSSAGSCCGSRMSAIRFASRSTSPARRRRARLDRRSRRVAQPPAARQRRSDRPGDADGREQPGRLAFALLCFGLLSMVLVYFIASELFEDRRRAGSRLPSWRPTGSSSRTRAPRCPT